MLPAELTSVRSAPTSVSRMSIVEMFVSDTSALFLLSVEVIRIDPRKLFPAFVSTSGFVSSETVNETRPAPAACVIGPTWLTPVAITVNVPVPRLDVPKMIVLTSVIATLPAPVVISETSPRKLFV